jgi:hypothetical protein
MGRLTGHAHLRAARLAASLIALVSCSPAASVGVREPNHRCRRRGCLDVIGRLVRRDHPV